ncbi:MAG: HdaA/DnaA family protein [Pseudomonadota bacterium]
MSRMHDDRWKAGCGPAMSRQLPLDLGHRTAFGREDFLVSASNRDAVVWLDLWPGWPGAGLVVVGPPACGKTHLAEVWRQRSGAARLGAAELGGRVPPAMLAGARSAVVEDLGRGAFDEDALLHLHNFVAEHGGHLLLTAMLPPARWAVALPDLKSRLAALPVAEIGPPDDALIEAALVKLFADRQLRVTPELVAYLVTRLERSLAAARRAVLALDAAALAGQRRITVPMARTVVRDQGRDG